MRYSRHSLGSTVLTSLAVVLLASLVTTRAAAGADETPYVPFVPTPQDVVEEMLAVARVSARDIVYDLGSGDGRIVITAAKLFGARGVGIEIDPDLVRDSIADAELAGVSHLVRFCRGDIFAADISQATVVTLFMLPEFNRKLLPKLLAELRPGTRIVAYKYPLEDWPAEKTIPVSRGTIYYWIVPPR